VAEPILELAGVVAGYSDTVVLEDVGLALQPGESVSVIGRNGVGKTTLLATVMGHASLHGGRIAFGGRDIARLPVHARARLGIGYVPQEREIFPSLTVIENLELAARPGAWTLRRVLGLFPSLAERRRNRGNQLSGGEQQMLAIGRALMGNPALLLLDEPSEGLAPLIVEELVQVMKRLRDSAALALVLVEQNARIALDFSPRAVVMERGRIVYDGAGAALSDDPDRLARLIGVAEQTAGGTRG
jgi:branched-chain amino acid transport system ATP-binding protein